ncbi:MAG TPA: nitroreductase/quinone reductase family protein [Solirubrobacteraceae bacterium]|jgi:deazaflavin-dependent oxidoreductase (nitroreductase family)
MAARLPKLLGTARAPARADAAPAARSSLRDAKRELSRAVTTKLVNPGVRALIERGLMPTNWVLLETRGRTSGKPIRTPVGDGLRDGVFWIVTEHGWASHYVKNIVRDPRVRIKRGRRWLTGTATILPDEDPYRRLRALGRPANDALLLLVGTEQLVIRVDLDG